MSPVMDVHTSMKATLLAFTILGMVTWLPRMFFYLRAFFLESMPSVASAVIAPKCLFIFSNIIVIFLVSESKLSRSSSESLNSDVNVAARGEGNMLSGMQEEEIVVMEELMEPMITGAPNQEQDDNMLMVVVEELDSSGVNEGVQVDRCEEEYAHLVQHEVDEAQGNMEEQRGELDLVLRDEASGKAGQDCTAEEEDADVVEERDLPPADELNRRVEDFIARFNLERQLESMMLVCCY